MTEYKTYELGEVCSRLSSGKGIPASKVAPEGKYPVYGGNGLRGFTEQSNFSGDCAIIGRQGAFCGNVRYFSGEAYMTEHAVVVCATPEHNTRYLAYLLSTMNLGRLSGQSAQPGLSVKTLAKQQISLPTLEIQSRVASILAKLDEKIELNNQINENLQQQVQTLFADWLSANSESATEVALGDVCTKVTDGSHFSPKDDPTSSIPMLSVKDMREFDFDLTSCKHICEDDYEKMVANDCVPQVNDILVAKDGSYLKEIFICNEQRKLAILSSIAIFRPNATVIHPEILLAFLKSPRVLREVRDNYVSGSALPRIVLKDFKKLTFALPNMDAQNLIAPLFMSIREQIAVNVAENKYMAQLRDTLLPKLMSGELSVDNIQL